MQCQNKGPWLGRVDTDLESEGVFVVTGEECVLRASRRLILDFGSREDGDDFVEQLGQ